MFEDEFSRFLLFLFFGERFWLDEHILTAPNDQIGAVFGNASLLRKSHEIVKTVKRRAQMPIRQDAAQTGHSHQQHDSQNRHRDDDLD